MKSYVIVPLLLLLVAACGGDGDESSETPVDVTPVGTKSATPTPGPVDGNGIPAPVEPELDEELTEAARGDLEAVIEAGESYAVDPESLAPEGGADICANFQFDFSWQITDPYPPDGTALTWRFANESAEFEVASGPNGNQAVGCGILTAVNGGPGAITVAIKYVIGTRQ